MKKAYAVAGIAMMAIGIATSCADKSAKTRVAEQRQQWETALADSIARLTHESDSLKSRLETLHEKAGTLLTQFNCVSNPREVEKYYLPQVAGYTYPLTSTGLGSRLTAGEELELVAVFNGPAFSGIRISGADGTVVSTPTVAHDQALNYRSGTTTTVAFSGEAVDSILPTLATLSAPISVTYIENSKTVGQTRLPEPQAKAFRLATELAATRRETLLSEKRLAIAARKISMLKSRENSN